MNWKALLSLLIIFVILGLIFFSPKGKQYHEEYTGKYTAPVGSFFKRITGRVTSGRQPIVSKKLEITITGVKPEDIKDLEFSLKGSGVNAELSYDVIDVMDGSISFPSKKVNVKVESMIGSVSFFRNGKMKITGQTDAISLNEMKLNKSKTEFLIVGDPISYVLEDIKKDKMIFSDVSGSLTWSGLRGIPPTLKNDQLELYGFMGSIIQEDESVTISGQVDRIKLNGVDIRLS